MIQRPDPAEYDAFYSTYMDKVPSGDVLELLAGGLTETLELLGGVPTEMETYRYAEGKWSIREVIGHITDTERVFVYRAFCMARGESAALPGMDQLVYAQGSNAAERSLAELGVEFAAVRAASLELFRGLSDTAWSRSGIASGVSFTVRVFPFLIAGHEIHHRELLRARYIQPS